MSTQVESPRIVEAAPMKLAGLRDKFSPETVKDIPALWQRFAPFIGTIAGQIGNVAYGASFAGKDGAFEYMAAVEVADVSKLPGEFVSVSVPAQRFAVFPHHGHVSRLPQTIGAICGGWLPGSGMSFALSNPAVPQFLERYGPGFDPATGMGDMEVWVAVQAKGANDVSSMR